MMSKSATITTRVEPELKENAEKILKQLGINTTQAINLFLKQIEIHKGLPFEVQLPDSAHKPSRVPGLHKGSMKTSDDFDAPLDDDFWLGNS